MNRIEGIEFNASEPLLRDAVGQEKLPDALLPPLQALIKRILEASAAKPFLIYLQSSDSIHGIRDYFAHALGRVLKQKEPSAILVDCDFMAPGMSGIVPQKDALGFLDYLLYGSSLSVVAQESLQGVKVVGAGSFPVSKKMPVSLDSFADAARRLAAQSRIVIFSGPAGDDDETIHAIGEMADLLMNVNFEKRFPVGRIDPLEEELAKKSGSPVISIRISSSAEVMGEGPWPVEEEAAEAPPKIEKEEMPVVPAREKRAEEEERRTKWQEEEAPRNALFSGPHYDKKRSGSVWAKIIPAIIAISLIGFLYWWFFITKPMRGTGEEARLAAADSAASGGALPAQDPLSRPEKEEETAGSDGAPAGESGDAGEPSQAEDDSASGGDRSAGTIRTVDDEGEGALPGTEGEGEAPLQEDQAAARGASPGEVHVANSLDEFTGRYLIHISSFRTMDRAMEDASYLVRNNFAGCVIPVDLGSKGIWYRVYVGPFDTREAAFQQKIMLDELPRVKFTRITP